MCKMISFSNQWFIDSHYLGETDVCHYAFAVYGLLQYIEPYHGAIVTSIDMIREYLSISEDSKAYMKHLKSAIKFLHDKEMIEFYSDIYMQEKIDCNIDRFKGKTFMYIRLINRPKDRMTLIKFTEFERILKESTLTSNAKMEMICYFSTIICHLDVKRKVSYPKLARLKDIARIGRYSTCTAYNNKLQDMGIMLYDNAGVKSRNYDAKGTGEDNGYVSNTYARPEHELELNQYIQQLRETHRAREVSKQKRSRGNTLKSIAMSIYHAKNRLEEYTNEEDIKAEKANIRRLEAQYKALSDSKE